MSISSVGPALSQLYSTQQAQALSAVSVDVPAGNTPDASAAQAGDDNALTGTTTSNLDSQTLQALLELTQQDPASPAEDSPQTGQARGAHHHHHHHGGGTTQAQAQSGEPPSSAPAVTSGSTVDAGRRTADASLEQILTTV